MCAAAEIVRALRGSRGGKGSRRRGLQILLIHLPIENETLHSGLRNNVVSCIAAVDPTKEEGLCENS